MTLVGTFVTRLDWRYSQGCSIENTPVRGYDPIISTTPLNSNLRIVVGHCTGEAEGVGGYEGCRGDAEDQWSTLEWGREQHGKDQLFCSL